MNQVEILFAILSRKVVRPANFAAVDAPRNRLLGFVDHFNRTIAKPFERTHQGKLLEA
jgi:putative transposase